MPHSDEPFDLRPLRPLFRYNPLEPCWSCGYALGVHVPPGYFYGPDRNGGCPDDFVAAYQRWGVM